MKKKIAKRGKLKIAKNRKKKDQNINTHLRRVFTPNQYKLPWLSDQMK